jgi:hypothetical protein
MTKFQASIIAPTAASTELQIAEGPGALARTEATTNMTPLTVHALPVTEIPAVRKSSIPNREGSFRPYCVDDRSLNVCQFNFTGPKCSFAQMLGFL